MTVDHRANIFQDPLLRDKEIQLWKDLETVSTKGFLTELDALQYVSDLGQRAKSIRDVYIALQSLQKV